VIKVVKLFSICIFFTLLSCKEEGVVYNKFFKIENSLWKHQDTLEFDFEIKDTTKTYELYFQFRNDKIYNWQNIFLFSYLKHNSQNNFLMDTLEFYLTDNSGRWLGKKSGNIIESNFFISKVKFPIKGFYKMNIQQAMRDTALEGCLDVGLKIKEINN
tara:strand:+ start:10567 stop:11040 length:474 start_codon:yes stop_codon:yes gene_type:complete